MKDNKREYNNKYITKHGVVPSGKKLYSTLKHLSHNYFIIDNKTGWVFEFSKQTDYPQWIYENEDCEDNNGMGKETYQRLMESLYE